MRLLLSNDDGIHAAGLAALAEAVAPLGEIFVVAPDREQSAASHAISLHRPLRLTEAGPRRYAVDGTPTDCIYLAVNHVLRDRRPDLVLSGINRGGNLGDDVTYSGTVAAAMEGALLGIPSVALSLVSPSRQYDYRFAASFARALAQALSERPLPRGALLNVNFPEGPIEGFALTRQGKRNYGQGVVEKVDPRGRAYYWIGGDEIGHDHLPGSDCNAVYGEKVVSVTPLHLDLTHDRLLGGLADLRIEGHARRG